MNYDKVYAFTLPMRVYLGYGCSDRTGLEARKLGIQAALIVTDVGVRKAGVIEPVQRSLISAGVRYEVFDEVPQDPNTSVIGRGLEVLKSTGCDGVVIVGGGSPLCAGKAIALLATNGGRLQDYEGVDKVKVPSLPVIAIPTTAGSGSEVSASLIVTDETRNDYKMTINSYYCYPSVALLDPLLLRTLPPRLFAISAADALSHAVEAIATTLATPLTDAIAYEALRLMFRSMCAAALSDDLEAKRDQLFASTIANIACGNAKLGLVHACSQPLGSFHVAHGLANAVLLPYVMEFNLPACEEKYARMAEVIGADKPWMTRAEKARAAIGAVKELLQAVNLPDRFSEDVVPRSAIPQLAKIAMGRPQVQFNIRKASEADLVEIYERSFEGYR